VDGGGVAEEAVVRVAARPALELASVDGQLGGGHHRVDGRLEAQQLVGHHRVDDVVLRRRLLLLLQWRRRRRRHSQVLGRHGLVGETLGAERLASFLRGGRRLQSHRSSTCWRASWAVFGLRGSPETRSPVTLSVVIDDL